MPLSYKCIFVYVVILSLFFLSFSIIVQNKIAESLRPGLQIRFEQLTDDIPISNVGLTYHSQSNHVNECKYFQTLPMTCDMKLVSENIRRILQQGGCLRPRYSTTTKTLFHMYLSGVQREEEGYFLSIKAYLITQDLRQTRLIIWTDDGNTTSLANNQFFRKHYPYVRVKIFNYDFEIRNTPLEKHSFFRSADLIRRAFDASTFSDIVRNLILHNYGHIWLDNDAVPLRDLLPITTGIGYQFIPAFQQHSNGHVLFLYPHSKLSIRILSNLVQFPMKFVQETKKYVPDEWPLQPQTKLEGWVYNDALPLLTKKQEPLNYTEDENRQFWYDIAWFDPLWRSCLSRPYDLTDVYNTTLGRQLVKELSCNIFFVLHTRYPRTKPSTFNDSLIYRLIKHIDTFFSDDDRFPRYKLEPMDLLICSTNM